MANYKILTNWMSVDDLEDKVRIGDLIEFKRIDEKTKSTIYHHWAVFIGLRNGEQSVIHFANDKNDFEFTLSRTGLKKDSVENGNKIRYSTLHDVAGKSQCRINNYSDNETEPLKGPIIIKKAESKLGCTEYNLITNNCEHFARWCRYGKSESSQIQIAEAVKKAANGYLHNGLEGALKNSGVEGIKQIRSFANRELKLKF
uniref:LRAT domain-containing protein n=1 Tax=Parastrongyloides trichosuri TaxID=131310 RepID=A0A0N4ZPN8_PARTI